MSDSGNVSCTTAIDGHTTDANHFVLIVLLDYLEVIILIKKTGCDYKPKSEVRLFYNTQWPTQGSNLTYHNA